MKLPKSNTQFEKVKVGEFVPGRIAKIEYDYGTQILFSRNRKGWHPASVRFVFELEGYKYQHKSRWMKFMAYREGPPL